MSEKQGLLDTCVVIDYDRDTLGEEPQKIGAQEWLDTCIDEGWRFFISTVTVMELMKKFAREPGRRRKEFKEFKTRLRVLLRERRIRTLPLTSRICRRARRLTEEFCQQYTPPKEVDRIVCDLLIAATALAHSLCFFTCDEAHFKWIPVLNVKRPDYRNCGVEETS